MSVLLRVVVSASRVALGSALAALRPVAVAIVGIPRIHWRSRGAAAVAFFLRVYVWATMHDRITGACPRDWIAAVLIISWRGSSASWANLTLVAGCGGGR